MPARVSVAIESQMTIYPESAEWVAVLRYDVIGGSLDAIHLKMPAAWAAGVALHLSGGEFQLTKETRGPDAFWTVTPARPIWGSQRFVLRGSRKLGSETTIVHPEITPRGEGVVDAYLSIINATGGPLKIDNSVGVDKITQGSKFQGREFARFGGTPVGAFRVVQKSWSLKVQSPRNAAMDRNAQDASARLSLADITLQVMPDRSIIGRAVYETVAGTGSILSCALPPGSSFLWATVDFNKAVPLQTSSGSWSIACDPQRESRIGMLWRTGPPPAAGSRGSTWSVALPRAGAGPAATLVSVYTPSGWSVRQEAYGGLELANAARLEMARADWLAHSALDLIAKFDRSSGRDHEKLVSSLISHEMALRSAERNLQWSERAKTNEERARARARSRRDRPGASGPRPNGATSRPRGGSSISANLSGRNVCQSRPPHEWRTRTGRAGSHPPVRPAFFPRWCLARRRGQDITRFADTSRTALGRDGNCYAFSIGHHDHAPRGSRARHLVTRSSTMAELACACDGPRAGRPEWRTIDPAGRDRPRGGRLENGSRLGDLANELFDRLTAVDNLHGPTARVVYCVARLMPMVLVRVAIRSITPMGWSTISNPSLSVAPMAWPFFIPPPPRTTDQLRGQ